MTSLSHIILDRRGAVDILTLNRPAQLNALSETMVAELLAYFQAAGRGDGVAAIALLGAGDHFCAGLDLKRDLGVMQAGPEAGMRFQLDYGELALRMRRCPVPVVAGLRGAVSGGGFSIATACDVRLGAPSLRANAAFARLGLSGMEMGLSFLLPRIVGHGLASELMLTGRFLEADEALRSGYVSRLVADEDVAEAAILLAQQIAANGDFGVRLTKESLNASWGIGNLDAAVALENRNQVLGFCSGAPSAAIEEFRGKTGRFAKGAAR